MESPRSRRDISILAIMLAMLSAAGIAAGTTILYSGMRVIMRTEGGFVAAGGPYEIAHPAPDWVWLIPLAVMTTIMLVMFNVFTAWRGQGINLVAVWWSALFIALGWNFLDFGISSPFGGGIEWGWLIPGVLFWVMGLAPLVLLGRWFREGWRRVRDRQMTLPGPGMFGMPSAEVPAAYVVAQVAGIALGVIGGIALFRTVTG
jgi:hypothetical protein